MKRARRLSRVGVYWEGEDDREPQQTSYKKYHNFFIFQAIFSFTRQKNCYVITFSKMYGSERGSVTIFSDFCAFFARAKMAVTRASVADIEGWPAARPGSLATSDGY